jgi:hypothetical protein
MAETSKSLEEIRAIRDRWAEMPPEEVKTEQKKLLASALRRIERIRKTKAKSAEVAASGKPKAAESKPRRQPVKPRAKTTVRKSEQRRKAVKS